MRSAGRSSSVDLPGLRIPLNLPACLVFGALAALILSPLFGARAAFVFLLFGGLLLASQPAHTVNTLLKYRAFMILPAFCGMSTLWSEFPALTLRYSVQLAITICVAIVITTRVAPAVLLRCLFAIYSIGIWGSMLFGRVRDDNGAWLGLFGSKNAFAAVVTGFALTSLALLLDRSAGRPLRLVAFGSTLLSVPMLVAAQSTGSLVFILPASAAILAVMMSRFLTRGQLILIGVLIALTLAIAVMVLVSYGDELLSAFLDYSGKDVTLTGRTDLWQVASDMISQRPLLGIGYQAFWVQGYGPAEDLWAMFGIGSRGGFNFHNTYLSNAVEIGIIGVAMQVVLLYGALFGMLRWALAAPTAESAFFVGFLTFLVGSSFIEAVVYFQFGIATIIAICAAVYALRYQEWRRAHH